MNKIYFFLGLLFFCQPLASQKFDNNWLIGAKWPTPDHNHMIINFEDDPPNVILHERELNIHLTSGSISDSLGKLLLYTNGVHIYNELHDLVENGDSINCCGSLYNDALLTGLENLQGAVFFPSSVNENEFFLVHGNLIPEEGVSIGKVQYSKIDLSSNNGKGVVLEKNEVLHEGLFENFSCVKHANGKDWWILYPDTKKSKFYRMLFNGAGFEGPFEQTIGTIPEDTFRLINMNKVFSLNGDKYVYFEILHGLSVFDFDRCSGELSNEKRIDFDIRGWHPGGAAISPNGRFLYIDLVFLEPPFTHQSPWTILLIQYDLWADDIPSTADTILNTKEFGFGYMQLGPDGRIYIDGGDSYHIINQPNKKGDDCEFQRSWLPFPALNNGTVPYFPNYRLGSIDSSPCDTLGIDNIPLAGFRCEADSLDSLTVYFTDNSFYEPADWAWDFAGMGISSDTNPVFTFPEYGIYEVCLTVSNENGEDSFCKTLELIPVGVGEENFKAQLVHIFPNPARGNLNIVFSSQGLNSGGSFSLQTISGTTILNEEFGKELKELNINVENVSPGVYFCLVKTHSGLVFTEKVILIK